MRIGIDISQIIYQTGVSRYTKELVEHLLAIDKENNYILFFSSLRQKIQNSKFKIQSASWRIKLKIFRLPPTFLDYLWNRLHFLNIENFIGKIDVFHSSDWTQPPSRSKKVTTVHDLSFLHYPQTFPKKIIETQKRRLYWVKKECDLVIVDSEVTKNDLVKLLGFDQKRIRVVYLGVNKVKSPAKKAGRRQSKVKSIIKKLKSKYNIGNKYLLYLGTLQPRKNLIRLIEAFNKIKSPAKKAGRRQSKVKSKDLKLVIAGKKGWLYEEIFEEVKELGLGKEVIFTGFVTEEEKLALLKNAYAFIYPSLYEGFGIPVLEAMQAGCPVVTSNVSSLPEVAGKAAVLVDPYKVEEIALAIKKVLENERLQKDLREKGLKQVKKFSWEKCARETLKVYEELI